MDIPNNVVKFPTKFKLVANKEENLDDVSNKVNMVKYHHINETMNVVIPMIYNNLKIAGFDTIDQDECVKDGALIIEAVGSLLCKHYGIIHPFHTLNDALFIQTGDQINELTIATKLDIVLPETTVPDIENDES